MADELKQSWVLHGETVYRAQFALVKVCMQRGLNIRSYFIQQICQANRQLVVFPMEKKE